MDNQELNKELADKIATMPGESRGVGFKTDSDYILKEMGEDGLKKLEEEMVTLGYPVNYRKIETLSFFPIGIRVISLLAIKKLFSFDDAKIEDMGLFASRTSLMLKLFINYFLSVNKVFFEEAPKVWRKHFSVGEIKPVEIDEEKKYGIVQINNYQLHPIFCIYLRGYLRGFFQMLINTPNTTAEETKCPFRGDEYHEYIIKWK